MVFNIIECPTILLAEDLLKGVARKTFEVSKEHDKTNDQLILELKAIYLNVV